MRVRVRIQLLLTVIIFGLVSYSSFIAYAQSSRVNVTYEVHLSDTGWVPSVTNGEASNNPEEGLSIEALRINSEIPLTYSGLIEDTGWVDPVSNSGILGTTGQGKRLEAVSIALDSTKYDVYYQAYVESYGWLGWAKNGEKAGSQDYGLKLQAIRIQILPIGSEAPGSSSFSFVYPGMSYLTSASAHIQDVGWQDCSFDSIGTTGQNRQIEAVRLNFQGGLGEGIEYHSHIQDYGDESGWKNNGEISGTTGEGKRLEAIQIRLTGTAADKYDIYYRAHSENLGWLDWAKNGEWAGTTGAGLKMEALSISILPKNSEPPGDTFEPCLQPISEDLFRARIHGCWVDATRAQNPTRSFISGIDTNYIYLGDHNTFNGYEGSYTINHCSTTGGSITVQDSYTGEPKTVYISYKDLPGNHLVIKDNKTTRELIIGDTTDGIHYTFEGLMEYGQLMVVELRNGI